MTKYKVVQTNRIIKGFQEKTYIIEANSAEEAETLVSNEDAEEHCINIDSDIERYEEFDIESEEV
jgi:hypothetical protein